MTVWNASNSAVKTQATPAQKMTMCKGVFLSSTNRTSPLAFR
jgi:hypothetical protein